MMKTTLCNIKNPLENYRDIDGFKIYAYDMRLFCTQKALSAMTFFNIAEELNDFFKCGIKELSKCTAFHQWLPYILLEGRAWFIDCFYNTARWKDYSN